ncbi:hypothetical protein [Glaciimonas sp. PCH181]|uniref:hypothetical protein n=1 Tax=Glaciimonas sp. PCH181 TaxID=2133943 RepID=UPI000D3538A5|nr:hypothetical protein [Glaciimonas sp. PCH181]PUA17993.1 hypothetical protein C7W93_19330 [Glaciimonas sp. PCH181]
MHSINANISAVSAISHQHPPPSESSFARQVKTLSNCTETIAVVATQPKNRLFPLSHYFINAENEDPHSTSNTTEIAQNIKRGNLIESCKLLNLFRTCFCVFQPATLSAGTGLGTSLKFAPTCVCLPSEWQCLLDHAETGIAGSIAGVKAYYMALKHTGASKPHTRKTDDIHFISQGLLRAELQFPLAIPVPNFSITGFTTPFQITLAVELGMTNKTIDSSQTVRHATLAGLSNIPGYLPGILNALGVGIQNIGENISPMTPAITGIATLIAIACCGIKNDGRENTLWLNLQLGLDTNYAIFALGDNFKLGSALYLRNVPIGLAYVFTGNNIQDGTFSFSGGSKELVAILRENCNLQNVQLAAPALATSPAEGNTMTSTMTEEHHGNVRILSLKLAASLDEQ